MLTAGNSPLPRSNDNYQLVRIQKVIDISARSRIGICGTISPRPILTKQADCILMSTQNVPMDLQISILASDCLQAFVRLSKKLHACPTAALMSRAATEDECGRFRTWCGNLGA